MTAQAAPKVLSGVAPYLSLDAKAAADVYKAAFAAEEVNRMSAPDGKIMHIHLYINGASVMLSDPFPEHGFPLMTPQAFTLHLQVDDADAWFNRAVEAGCTVQMPLADMFWGDRYGSVIDPFGVTWSMGSPLDKG